MRNHRDDATLHEAAQNLVQRTWDESVCQLHQQIPEAVDRIFRRKCQRVLNVVVAEMEIAALVNLRKAFRFQREFRDALPYKFRLESVSDIGVRSSHDIGSTAFSRHPQHRDALVPIARAVVQAPEDVAVNVDQTARSLAGSISTDTERCRMVMDAMTRYSLRTAISTPSTPSSAPPSIRTRWPAFK